MSEVTAMMTKPEMEEPLKLVVKKVTRYPGSSNKKLPNVIKPSILITTMKKSRGVIDRFILKKCSVP